MTDSKQGILMDGNRVANIVFERVQKDVRRFSKQMGRPPHLSVVLFGNDPASRSYIRKKESSAKTLGITVSVIHKMDVATEDGAIEVLRSVQASDDLDGLIVQLPFPDSIHHVQRVLDEIDPVIDVDCLTTQCTGYLAAGTPLIVPPTASAVFELLDFYDISLEGKHVVIVGHGKLVGKPLSILLTQKTTTVTVCNEFTQDLSAHTLQADVLISATGQKELIDGSMVKEGAVVLDAGTSVAQKKVFGDVNQESVLPRVSFLSPVPGGVGPVTVAKLLENVVQQALSRFEEGE